MFFILFRRRHIQIRSHYIYNKPKFKFIYFDRKFMHNTLDDVPTISLTEMKRNLKSSNISFLEGHTCLLADCPLCGNKSKLYINKTTGIFYCFNFIYFVLFVLYYLFCFICFILIKVNFSLTEVRIFLSLIYVVLFILCSSKCIFH